MGILKIWFVWSSKTLLEFTEEGEISEEPAHKVFSFKVGDIIVKWYSSTPTAQTQVSVYTILRETLGNLFASKVNLLALQPNCDTQQCPFEASNESTAVDCSFNSSQNLQSVTQTAKPFHMRRLFYG